MNEKQMAKIESALMSALTYLQCHSETKPTNEAEYDHVLDELRSALSLFRAWKALAKGLGHPDDTQPRVLPGQLTIPGMPPDDKTDP